MKPKNNAFFLALTSLFLVTATAWIPLPSARLSWDTGPTAPKVQRYLYVATPGVRNYLGYGGHGIQVFDIDNNHRFVKFIKTAD